MNRRGAPAPRTEKMPLLHLVVPILGIASDDPSVEEVEMREVLNVNQIAHLNCAQRGGGTDRSMCKAWPKESRLEGAIPWACQEVPSRCQMYNVFMRSTGLRFGCCITNNTPRDPTRLSHTVGW
eukprot:gene7216-biopygen2518